MLTDCLSCLEDGARVLCIHTAFYVESKSLSRGQMSWNLQLKSFKMIGPLHSTSLDASDWPSGAIFRVRSRVADQMAFDIRPPPFYLSLS